jgi:uncharacterized protein (UPF0261 family)
MGKTIAVIATLDTKGAEAKYIKEQIEKRGMGVLVIDTGLRGDPIDLKADITREMFAEASGTTVEAVRKEGRGQAIEMMAKGIAKVSREYYDRGQFQGMLAIGGSDGALLASAGMQAVPLGVPKFIVTPIAEGKETFGPYVGTADIIMMHSVVDMLGINEISRKILDNAVGAVMGMVEMAVDPTIRARNLIAVTMYGNTTPAVMRAKNLLEAKGYEVVVFHPNGTGGRAMEELIEQGLFNAVLDMTTHEITDELCNGLHAAGPHRLEAAGKKGIPQVIVPGAVDFILGGPMHELPPEWKKRKVYYFNQAVSLIRTTKEEMVTIGKIMAEKINMAVGPTLVLIPLGGFSMYTHEGELLHDPEGDQAWIQSLKKHLKPHIPVMEVAAHINDPIFAETAVDNLIKLMNAG